MQYVPDAKVNKKMAVLKALSEHLELNFTYINHKFTYYNNICFYNYNNIQFT